MLNNFELHPGHGEYFEEILVFFILLQRIVIHFYFPKQITWVDITENSVSSVVMAIQN